MDGLQKALGYYFRNPSLLKQALTHPSVKAGDNQRLEFLGDAVLEFLISDLLYHKYPGFQEGELTAKRAALVCEETLCYLARSLGIGRCLLLAHGEELTSGRDKPSILADAMEAVLAAVYLDGGVASARSLVERLFTDERGLSEMRGRDDKGLLQEYTQSKGLALPSYEIIKENGPPHDRRFTARVSVLGRTLAEGEGSSKKAAEQEAARRALKLYNG